MSKLQELKAAFIADGKIDATEAAELKSVIYEDGIIDKEEADVLFEINDAVSGNANDVAYEDLFVDAITDYVLADEVSPGVVDAEEAAYIIEKVSGDEQLDVLEQRLLRNIVDKAVSVDASLTDFIATTMGAEA